jgi:quercetin dioxygenase-like cupin family protein
MVSQVEKGKAMPSVATLYAIARELAVPLDGLIGANELSAPPPVVRAGARRATTLARGVTAQSLTDAPEPGITFMLITYAPGSRLSERLAERGTTYGVVTSGRLGITVGAATYELSKGDAVKFDSELSHRSFCIGDQAAEAIWIAVDSGRAAP